MVVTLVTLAGYLLLLPLLLLHPLPHLPRLPTLLLWAVTSLLDCFCYWQLLRCLLLNRLRVDVSPEPGRGGRVVNMVTGVGSGVLWLASLGSSLPWLAAPTRPRYQLLLTASLTCLAPGLTCLLSPGVREVVTRLLAPRPGTSQTRLQVYTVPPHSTAPLVIGNISV